MFHVILVIMEINNFLCRAGYVNIISCAGYLDIMSSYVSVLVTLSLACGIEMHIVLIISC